MTQPVIDPASFAEALMKRLRAAMSPFGTLPPPDRRRAAREPVRRELRDVLDEIRRLPAPTAGEVRRELDRELGCPAGFTDLLQRSVRASLDYERELDQLLGQLGA